MHRRRVAAIVRKEQREYRRNRSLVAAMTIVPLVFVIQPLVSVFLLPSSAGDDLAHRHGLLYLLATPILREEFLVGKALAALAPAVVVSSAVYAAFLRVTLVFARAGAAGALI